MFERPKTIATPLEHNRTNKSTARNLFKDTKQYIVGIPKSYRLFEVAIPLLSLLFSRQFLLVGFTLVVRDGGILVLLVLGNQIVHVGFSFSKFPENPYQHVTSKVAAVVMDKAYISSIPSPVYQCKKALRLNMTVNWSPIRLKSSWMLVEFPMKVELIFNPLGGIEHRAVRTLLGIHSTKYDEFLFCTLCI